MPTPSFLNALAVGHQHHQQTRRVKSCTCQVPGLAPTFPVRGTDVGRHVALPDLNLCFFSVRHRRRADGGRSSLSFSRRGSGSLVSSARLGKVSSSPKTTCHINSSSARPTSHGAAQVLRRSNGLVFGPHTSHRKGRCVRKCLQRFHPPAAASACSP